MNLMSAVPTRPALIPGMIARGGGAIVHISLVVSRVPAANLLPHSVAKAVLNSYSKGLRTELAAHWVRVKGLPGQIETDGMTTYLPGAASTRPGAPARTARPCRWDAWARHDVARMVLFLATDQARYLTGGKYTVDGGMAPGHQPDSTRGGAHRVSKAVVAGRST